MRGNRAFFLACVGVAGAFLLAWKFQAPEVFGWVAVAAIGGKYIENGAERWRPQVRSRYPEPEPPDDRPPGPWRPAA